MDSSTPKLSHNPQEHESRRGIHRTRTGCQTCRYRKIKCDEKKPSCTQCSRGSRDCTWSGGAKKRTRTPRRANATACEECRHKKLRCTNDINSICERCQSQGIECIRLQQRAGPVSPRLSESSPATNPTASQNVQLGQLPESTELQRLVHLYFSSVHHFGFFAFIHPLHFQKLLANDKSPRELTLMMIASATRFGALVTAETLAQADAWADAAISALLPRIYQGFGVIQLMTGLLAQHYDLHRGNFTSAWLLGASCTRMMQMMSLHIFDQVYPESFPSHQSLSPLLSRESLRRIAWSTFYLDSMIDGGRYGSQTIDECAYRIQLPCDQESFLGDDQSTTEPLIPDASISVQRRGGCLPHASLDMSAYLLRTAAARRRGLHFAFRASYQENTVEHLSTGLSTTKKDFEAVYADLPRRFQLTDDNLLLHRDRLPMFILLHVLRNNLFIILGRAALLIYLRDSTKADLINNTRRDRISRALTVSDLISVGLKENIIFDPHIGVQAYVALEILLFEPRRLASVDASTDSNNSTLTEGIVNCLTVIRDISTRSVFTKHLYLEAIHRLIKFDCMHILDSSDLEHISSKHPLIGQDAAEFDFRDLRGAKLERLSKLNGKPGDDAISATHDEVLLDDSLNRETTSSSTGASNQPPTFGASDIQLQLPENISHAPELPDARSLPSELNVVDYDLLQDGQQWREVVEPGNIDHLFSSLNWLWPFEEWTDQIDPSTGRPGFP